MKTLEFLWSVTWRTSDEADVGVGGLWSLRLVGEIACNVWLALVPHWTTNYTRKLSIKDPQLLVKEWLSPDSPAGQLVMDLGAIKSDLNWTLTPK